MKRIKTTLRMSKKISKKLKHYAVDKEKSQNEVIIEAIKNYIGCDNE